MSRAFPVLAALFFSAVCFVACGATTPQRVTIVVDRPGQPWPSDAPPCSIPRLAEASPCSRAVEVYPDAEGTSPIAVISRPSEVDLAWRALPVLGGTGRAKVDVFAPLLFSGWASLAGAPFSMTEDVALRSKHLVVKAGTEVMVLGTSRDKVVVRVSTSFKRPDAVELSVACSSIGYGSPRRSGSSRVQPEGHVVARKNAPVELRSSPEGAVLLVFEPGEGQIFRSVAQRDRSLRIASGAGPSSERLYFDGWTDVRQFYQMTDEPPDNDGGHCVPDAEDLCPSSLGQVLRDAMFYIGPEPPGRHFATIKSGTTVRVEQHIGEFLAVSFVDGVVSAPSGQRYFVPLEAVGFDCPDGEGDTGVDGCPPCVRLND